MKQGDIFKEIFQLAVRLTGLFFLCIGLKDLVVQTFITLPQLRGASPVNIVAIFLPVGFTLAVAVWLLRGTWLIRMAYPEPHKNIHHTFPPEKPASPEEKTADPKKFSEMETAEQKLAALVRKPNHNPTE